MSKESPIKIIVPTYAFREFFTVCGVYAWAIDDENSDVYRIISGDESVVVLIPWDFHEESKK